MGGMKGSGGEIVQDKEKWDYLRVLKQGRKTRSDEKNMVENLERRKGWCGYYCKKK